MRVKFNGNCYMDGVKYVRGRIYTVADSYKEHWFFIACLEKGRVSVLVEEATADTTEAKVNKKTTK